MKKIFREKTDLLREFNSSIANIEKLWQDTGSQFLLSFCNQYANNLRKNGNEPGNYPTEDEINLARNNYDAEVIETSEKVFRYENLP